MYLVRRWVVSRASLFAALYTYFEKVFVGLTSLWNRIGLERLDRVLAFFERPTKKLLFDCKMCGDCLLSSDIIAERSV